MYQHWDFKSKEVMYRRRIPFAHVILATVLGVGSAMYIYKPYFELKIQTTGRQNESVPKKQSEMDDSSS